MGFGIKVIDQNIAETKEEKNKAVRENMELEDWVFISEMEEEGVVLGVICGITC